MQVILIATVDIDVITHGIEADRTNLIEIKV